MHEVPYGMSIGGRRVFSATSDAAINPATEKVICHFPVASRDQLDDAVNAATKAFGSWSVRPLSERQELVAKLGSLMQDHREAFLRLLTTEQGKSRAGAEWEVDGSIYWLREVAKQSLPPENVLDQGDHQIVTRFVPIGVVGGITPWNFPILLAVWKIAPALVAGNTMVLKPSPYTPLCTLWLGELAQQVLPPGVLNVVSGGERAGSVDDRASGHRKDRVHRVYGHRP